MEAGDSRVEVRGPGIVKTRNCFASIKAMIGTYPGLGPPTSNTDPPTPTFRPWGVSRLRSWAPALLTILVLSLPFEATRPLLDLGFVKITNVETALYLTILAWLLGLPARRWRDWSACHAAVLVWAIAVVLSAALAPQEKTAAIKFALRSLGGCAVFFVAADSVYSTKAARRYLLAIAIGAGASSMAACAEVWWPAASRLLTVFKMQPSAVGSYVRASGTFQYTTIAAMYWEASAPVGLVLTLIYMMRREKKWRGWCLLVVTVCTVEATMLSLSRAATLITPILLLLCLIAARTILKAPLLITCSLAVAVMAPSLGQLLFSESLHLRMRTTDLTGWYRVDYAGSWDGLELGTGQIVTLPVKLRNSGALVWNAGGRYPFALSYHWENPEKAGIVLWDGLRTSLPFDVEPGREVVLQARIKAPQVTGNYVLELDMVHEDVTWFSMQGSPGPRVRAEVRLTAAGRELLASDAEALELESVIRPRPPASAARIDLWRAGLRMWREHPLLGMGPDNFRRLYGPYLSLAEWDDRIHSNSWYIESLACTGLVGLLALGLVAVTLAAALRRHWCKAPEKEARMVTLGVAAALAAYFLHGTVDYFLEFTATYGLFWLLAGLVAGLARSESGG